MTKTEQIQDIFNLTIDDKWGPRTDAAVAAEKSASIARHANPVPLPVIADGDKVDERSERAISTLILKVQPLARQLVKAAAQHGIKIKITSGTRTYAEQNLLYEQGRSKPGKQVTNARGGYSWHNFGIAVDVTIFDDNGPVWESPAYKTVGKLGKALGFEWGGDWQGDLVDEPHFQYNPGHITLAQARALHAQGKDIA
jgi:peptidoglycan L-alanyl-D-glutamate endopeptidase CwlK